MKRPGTKRLETPRLVLRRFTMNDAKKMYRNWAGDGLVTKYLSWPTHESEADSEAVPREWIDRYDRPDFYQSGDLRCLLLCYTGRRPRPRWGKAERKRRRRAGRREWAGRLRRREGAGPQSRIAGERGRIGIFFAALFTRIETGCMINSKFNPCFFRAGRDSLPAVKPASRKADSVKLRGRQYSLDERRSD